MPGRTRPKLRRAAIVLSAALAGGALGAGAGRHLTHSPKNPQVHAMVLRTIAEAKAGSKDAQAKLRAWEHSANVAGGAIGGLAGTALGLTLTRRRKRRFSDWIKKARGEK